MTDARKERAKAVAIAYGEYDSALAELAIDGSVRPDSRAALEDARSRHFLAWQLAIAEVDGKPI